MSQKIFSIPIDDVLPSVAAVLEGQGIPRWKQSNGRTTQLAQDAIAFFQELATPVSISREISKNEFKKIFEGEHHNETDSPVGPIFQESTGLTIFAVTIGQSICSEIQRLFTTNDFALGSMLDSAASEGVEMTAQVVENLYKQELKVSSRLNSHSGVLRFSPGFCGWHISGQRTLFEALRPDEIGITLNESYLMQPLKSISGVIIAGAKEIFCFDDTFSFCRDCADHSCRERIQSIMNN
ncbi:MAG: hypothetical protein HYZ34_00790 [Ignavibacteriae bacterium]|nr:hypothetical protein [Ignavibacteriota bacterium]